MSFKDNLNPLKSPKTSIPGYGLLGLAVYLVTKDYLNPSPDGNLWIPGIMSLVGLGFVLAPEALATAVENLLKKKSDAV